MFMLPSSKTGEVWSKFGASRPSKKEWEEKYWSKVEGNRNEKRIIDRRVGEQCKQSLWSYIYCESQPERNQKHPLHYTGFW